MQTRVMRLWIGGVVGAVAVAAGTGTLARAFNPQPDPPGDSLR